jgi:hypothetical protein
LLGVPMREVLALLGLALLIVVIILAIRSAGR